MTFKRELRLLKKEALGVKKTHLARKAIREYIKEELRKAAKEGKDSKRFPINLEEKCLSLEEKEVKIQKWDYIWFAIVRGLNYNCKESESFLSENYVEIFF